MKFTGGLLPILPMLLVLNVFVTVSFYNFSSWILAKKKKSLEFKIAQVYLLKDLKKSQF